MGFEPKKKQEPVLIDPLKPQTQPQTDVFPDLKVLSFFANNEVVESFRWMEGVDSLTMRDTGTPNSIRIRGVAATGDVVSLNHRKYLTEELKKSVSSMVGKSINVNHDRNKKIGKIEWADWEDNRLEWTGVVFKEPYVSMLRGQSKEVKGVSIDAKYLYNKCPKCHKNFTTKEAWRDHMQNVEFVKDGLDYPHGIVFPDDALSIVVAPETPGIPNTSIEVESSEGWTRLTETFLKDRGYLTESIEDVKALDGLSHRHISGGTATVVHSGYGPYVGMPKLALEKVEQRGNQWCVIHCHGPDEGKPIKCFPTPDEAYAMHTAIKEHRKDPTNVREFNKVMESAPEPYKTAWTTFLESFLKIAEMWNGRAQVMDQTSKLQETVSMNEVSLKKAESVNQALMIRVSKRDAQIKQLEETVKQKTETEAKLLKENTDMANRLDKVRGKFKGTAQQVHSPNNNPILVDPLKETK